MKQDLNPHTKSSQVDTQAIDPVEQAFQLGHKARANFDWPNVSEVMVKVKEELLELEASFNLDKSDQIHELGDLLFTIVQVARHLKIDPKQALNLCNQRHSTRMNMMKSLAVKDGKDYDSLTLAELESYWSLAKVETHQSEKETILKYLDDSSAKANDV